MTFDLDRRKVPRLGFFAPTAPTLARLTAVMSTPTATREETNLALRKARRVHFLGAPPEFATKMSRILSKQRYSWRFSLYLRCFLSETLKNDSLVTLKSDLLPCLNMLKLLPVLHSLLIVIVTFSTRVTLCVWCDVTLTFLTLALLQRSGSTLRGCTPRVSIVTD